MKLNKSKQICCLNVKKSCINLINYFKYIMSMSWRPIYVIKMLFIHNFNENISSHGKNIVKYIIFAMFQKNQNYIGTVIRINLIKSNYYTKI